MRSFVMYCMLLFSLAASANSFTATLAGADEPGVRLNVHGYVMDAAGRPIAGATVKAHHADARGLYHLPGMREPRLRGTVVTDARGRFELHTIRPGSYPGTNEAGHIHFEVSAAGYATQWPVLEFENGSPANDATIRIKLKKP